jgi:lysophospholipase L1-like esterase
VRREAPVLPEAEGPREGVSGEGLPLRLLVLGDSAGAGVGATTQDEALAGRILARLGSAHRVQWRVVARTGATTASTIRHLERLDPFATDVVVTSLGVNDVTGDLGVARFLALQARLHAILKDKLGVRLVIASGLPPMGLFPALPQPLRWYLGERARELDQALAQWLSDCNGAEHLPFQGEVDVAHMASDGFHPGPAIYDAWGEAAARRIASFFGRG